MPKRVVAHGVSLFQGPVAFIASSVSFFPISSEHATLVEIISCYIGPLATICLSPSCGESRIARRLYSDKN